MPIWVTLLTSVLGGGVLAGVIGAVLGHKFQQRRERAQEQRVRHATRVAQQRELSLTLLDAVNRLRNQLSTFESFHDDRAGRFFNRGTLKLALHDMKSAMEPIWKMRRELDLEPDAQLQAAIDRFGDTALAYQQAIKRALGSPWNPFQIYVGKIPPAEQSRLAQEYAQSVTALQEAVRAHMEHIQQQARG